MPDPLDDQSGVEPRQDLDPLLLRLSKALGTFVTGIQPKEGEFRPIGEMPV